MTLADYGTKYSTWAVGTDLVVEPAQLNGRPAKRFRAGTSQGRGSEREGCNGGGPGDRLIHQSCSLAAYASRIPRFGCGVGTYTGT